MTKSPKLHPLSNSEGSRKGAEKEPKKGAERKLDILQKLEENPEITQIKLMEEFDLSRKQIQKIIKELRRKGVIIYNHQHKI